MATSLSEQLLQAGLITKEKIDKAEKEKEQRKQSFKKRRNSATPHPSSHPKKKSTAVQKTDDLSQFYRQRNIAEKKEKVEQEAKRKEEAILRKARKAKVRALIKPNMITSENPDIRYNFVISNKVKYTFVTQAHLDQLINAQLGITMYSNDYVLIPKAIAEEIKATDKSRLVFIPKVEENTDTLNLEQKI